MQCHSKKEQVSMSQYDFNNHVIICPRILLQSLRNMKIYQLSYFAVSDTVKQLASKCRALDFGTEMMLSQFDVVHDIRYNESQDSTLILLNDLLIWENIAALQHI